MTRLYTQKSPRRAKSSASELELGELSTISAMRPRFFPQFLLTSSQGGLHFSVEEQNKTADVSERRPTSSSSPPRPPNGYKESTSPCRRLGQAQIPSAHATFRREENQRQSGGPEAMRRRREAIDPAYCSLCVELGSPHAGSSQLLTPTTPGTGAATEKAPRAGCRKKGLMQLTMASLSQPIRPPAGPLRARCRLLAGRRPRHHNPLTQARQSHPGRLRPIDRSCRRCRPLAPGLWHSLRARA